MAPEPKIGIACLTYGFIPAECFANLIDFFWKSAESYDIEAFVSSFSLTAHCKNELLQLFLKSDCTHLLFVDPQVLVKAEALEKLLAANKDAVAAGTGKKAGLNEVEFATTDFMLIKRGAIEQLSKSLGNKLPFSIEYSVDLSKRLGEDEVFSKNLRQLGYKIYIDNSVVLAK